MNKDVIKHLVSMRHSPLRNYIVPGLASWFIMANGTTGKIRLFESSRNQQDIQSFIGAFMKTVTINNRELYERSAKIKAIAVVVALDLFVFRGGAA